MSGWTEARVATLRKLWAEGLSASQIAKQLGEVTRSAVLGKAFRINLPRHVTLDRPRARRPLSQRPRLKPPIGPRIAPTPIPATQEAWHLALLPPVDPTLKLDRLNAFTCRYPIGDPKDAGFTYCGRTCDEERPYCQHHTKLCYQPETPAAKRSIARLARYVAFTDSRRMARADIAL